MKSPVGPDTASSTLDAELPEPTPTLLSPFASPVFRSIWLASLVSNFGGMIQSVGASWLMVSIGSDSMVALVQAAITLPIMFLSLPAGALADTVDRRKMLLYAQGFMLAMSVGLAVCAALGLITPWLLLFFTFMIGCGGAMNAPAWQASVGDMVPRRDLAGAIALNSMGFNVARSVGPAIGGVIVAAAGAAAAIFVNTFSYFGILLVLARWKPERRIETLPRETLWSAMGAGLRYGAMSAALKVIMIRSLVFGAAGSAVLALMPLVARDGLGGGPQIYGLLLGGFGVGAVGGGLAVTRLRRLIDNETIVRAACIAFGSAAILLGFSSWIALSMAALALTGAAWVLGLSTFNVTVQMSAPRWVVARALALYQLAAFGGMALGSWLWGLAAEQRGLAFAMCGAGLLQLLCATIGLRYRLASAPGLNLDPAAGWTEPQLPAQITPRSGPVAVTIEYVIADHHTDAFLRLMAERRLARRRNGARGWTLLRDLAEPVIWIERYQSPTWIDYLRHNQRVTQADRQIAEGLMALHQGPGKPKVRRMLESPARPAAEDGGLAQSLTEPLTDPHRAT
jgi:MFS family permease